MVTRRSGPVLVIQRMKCGRCSEEIVGVIPIWDDETPVCRSCAYAGPVRVRYRVGVKVKDEDTSAAGSRITLPGVIGFIALLLLAALMLKNPVSLGRLQPVEPVLFEGTAQLDRAGIKCVRNLSVFAGYLTEGAVTWPSRRCPVTGRPYDVVRETGNVIVLCPNPSEHGLSSLRVSLRSPVPWAE